MFFFSICRSISALKETCNNVFTDPSPKANNKERLVRWTKPGHGTSKVNTYGNSFSNLGCEKIGGLVRDEHGRWIVVFFGQIRFASNTQVELEAIY